MWGQFIAAYCFGAIALVIPGFIAFSALRLSVSRALAASPLFTCAAIPILCIVYDVLGVHCTWQNVLLPILGLSLILFAGSVLMQRLRFGGLLSLSSDDRRGTISAERRRIAWLCGYGLFAIVATGLVFVMNLDGADSFVQEFDNAHHLSTIQTFAVSGNWSSFSQGFYAPWEERLSPTALTYNFYPSAWHAFCAMLVNAFGFPAPVAANVANSLFVSLVLSFGMYWMISEMLGEDRRVLVCGMVCAFAFAAFPWTLMWWGPIYPNLVSLCVAPLFIAAIMAMFKAGVPLPCRFDYALLSILGLVSLVFMQPNTVFTSGVFLVPFFASRIVAACGGASSPRRLGQIVKIMSALIGFFAFVVIAWMIAFNLPIMANVVKFSWPSFTGGIQAIIDVVLLSFGQTPAQPVLGLLVLIGALIMFRDGICRWAIGSFLLMAVLFWISAATDGPLKQSLTGFWYTDPRRLAANVVIAAIPVACIGMQVAVSFLTRRFSCWWARGGMPKAAGACASAIAFVLMLLGIYSPNFTVNGIGDVKTGIGGVRNDIEAAYSTSVDNVLNPEERDFLQKVKRTVSPDELILNEPNDGSALAYGAYGMNVYYRGFDGYSGKGESKNSYYIRLYLSEIETNAQVRSAVDSLGARYVLQLDQDDEGRENRYLYSYCDKEWVGIDSIRDDTPGFEIMLSEGDMRLYKIR